ncbi:PIG-M-domain-containing protein [Lipomyces chichibuensis]|uniref:PIG-M-domain-containing protein n=1 Tax=Lipomyces chichibuensis TaxID=1546026 RepID=UPI0033437A40
MKLTTARLLISAALMRVAFFFYGVYQDEHAEIRFTDIDYFVFTDASKFMAQGGTPYDRATYRYTPILAWLLLPTTRYFWFGKLLFALGDIVAGWLMLRIFQLRGLSNDRALKFASVWLLNPMVATISTRGSSEGLLGAMVIALMWAVYEKQIVLSGLLTGYAVHFKIYPIIYVPSILWALDSSPSILGNGILRWVNKDRVKFALSSVITFTTLTAAMYYIYGHPFLLHTYLHHLSRSDHRHNFSPYNILLYISASPSVDESPYPSLAFLPQLFISGIFLPLMLAKKDLAKTMFVQTFAFVTFNKVCTSQYFMWYIVLLPFYLPSSAMLKNKWLGIWALILWTLAQALWLQQGFELEYLGNSTFVPGIFAATLIFFSVNIWILGVAIEDI